MKYPSMIGDPRIRLAILIAGLVPAFAIALTLVGRYKQQRQNLGVMWAQRGARDLAANPLLAVADYQTALSYRPDATADRLNLSEALIAANHPEEAESHLLTLWAAEPGDGRINLDLARLSAAQEDITEAVRYYHAAIDGAWDVDAAVSRRNARLELAKLLLDRGQAVRAQAELIALIDDLPSDPALTTEVGRLLVSAGADARAVGLFQRALQLDPHDSQAALLEGEVQFRAGQYAAARQMLAQASKEGAPMTASDQMMLDESTRVPALDPLALHLSTRERARRALQDLSIARDRLARCAPPPSQAGDAQHVADLSRRADDMAKLRQRQLERDPDQVDQMAALVFEIEALPAQTCGPLSNDDRALQLIAAERRAQVR
ncbi:MAG: tetratricopeptide repeat protein [Vicinamibacterales bacterium]